MKGLENKLACMKNKIESLEDQLKIEKFLLKTKTELVKN